MTDAAMPDSGTVEAIRLVLTTPAARENGATAGMIRARLRHTALGIYQDCNVATALLAMHRAGLVRHQEMGALGHIPPIVRWFWVDPPPPRERSRYEYRQDTCDVWQIAHLCNRNAEDGWDVVAVVESHGDGVWVPEKIDDPDGPSMAAPLRPYEVLFRRVYIPEPEESA